MAKKTGTVNDLVDAATKDLPPDPTDPIEAAKVTKEDVKEAVKAAVAKPQEPSIPPPAPAADAPVSSNAGKSFVVRNSGKMTVSWRGQTCRFRAGDVVSENSYGDGAIQKFRDAGLKLEELETK